VRGDDTQPITAGADEFRERRGPRHAAPRKSLLTKLQIPAGKAMALAAMPTAVFVGMGLTPRLALADDNKDIPYSPGPCVTRSDEPSPGDSASPSPSASDSASPKPGDSASGSPTPSPSGSSSDGSGGSGGSGGGKTDAQPKPSATSDTPGAPKPSADTGGSKGDTSDPLGLGGLLGGLLGGGSDKASPSPSATEKSASPSKTSSDKAKPKPKASDPVGELGDSVGKTVGKTLDGAKDTADATKKAIQDAADKAGAKVHDLDDDAKGLAAQKDGDIPAGADGKEPFPCPTADPDALANAKEEQGIPLLPDKPWTLHSSKLTLSGLKYHGIVEVRTYGGTVKKVLKFTAQSIDIKDLDQTVDYPGDKTAHVESTPGSTSTIRNGEVTLYTEQLKGNLFGLIPITFSPETPPPVDIPYAFFTNAEVSQAGQFGGTLTIPGLHNYID
jgi:hypothetical protein